MAAVKKAKKTPAKGPLKVPIKAKKASQKAPRELPGLIKSWSFSRHSTYKQCPLKAKLLYIDKLKEPPNSAMARGNAIHLMAENFIKGHLKELPAELKMFEKDFTYLRDRYTKKVGQPAVEDNWAFTRDWSLTRWDDWAHCWVRIKLDCAHEEKGDVLIITDWKTGKFREDQNADYLAQLKLYALGALLMPRYAHIKEIRPRLAYLDLGFCFDGSDKDKGKPAIVYTRKDLPALKAEWEKLVTPMLSDQAFPPRPNKFCNWCFFRAANKTNGGGQCRF